MKKKIHDLTIMYIYHRLAIPLLLYLFSSLTSSAPAQNSLSSSPPNGIALPQPEDSSLPPELLQHLNLNNSHLGLPKYWVSTWEITPERSIRIEVHNFDLSPARIVSCIEHARRMVGKKQAGAFLTEEFKAEEGSVLNRMLFEVDQNHVNPWDPTEREMKLTWGDVALVLGPDG